MGFIDLRELENQMATLLQEPSDEPETIDEQNEANIKENVEVKEDTIDENIEEKPKAIFVNTMGITKSRGNIPKISLLQPERSKPFCGTDSTHQYNDTMDVEPEVTAVDTNYNEKCEVKDHLRIDDYIRNFLAHYKLTKTLAAFQDEWYSRDDKLPDTELATDRLELKIVELEEREEKSKELLRSAHARWTELRKQSDTHQRSHMRLEQEKQALLKDIQRMRGKLDVYEPTIAQLKEKYEQAMKARMLVKLQLTKEQAKTSLLTSQLGISPKELTTSQQPNNTLVPMRQTIIPSAGREWRDKKGLATLPKKTTTLDQLNKIRASEYAVATKVHGYTTLATTDNLSEDHIVALEKKVPRKTCKIWQSLKSLECICIQQLDHQSISCINSHPSQPLLAAACDDGRWVLLNYENNTLEKVAESSRGGSWLGCIGFHEAGNIMFMGNSKGVVEIWNMCSVSTISSVAQHSGPILSLTSINDNMITGSVDKTIKSYDIRTLKHNSTFRGHTEAVGTLEAITNNMFISGSADQTITAWDTRSGLAVQTMFGCSSAVQDIAYCDNIVSCVDANGYITVFDMRSTDVLHSEQISKSALNTILMKDDKWLASGDDGFLRDETNISLPSSSTPILSLALGLNGQIFTSGSDGIVNLWQSTFLL